MDWRHIGELLEAGGAVYDDVLNSALWVKSNAGQGSFYRSQHELVWHYAGVNTFRAGRLDDLQSHPTVKPVALVADAMKDCTRRGDIVLDTFCGSGTTILAAERVGRRAYTLELEPRCVDVAVRRWQAFSRKDAIRAETGLTFDEVASERPAAPAAA
jgi:DNA modification methylase